MKKNSHMVFVLSMLVAFANSYSQDLIMEQPMMTTDQWAFTSALHSDINYEVADNFFGLDATVNQIVFYGLYAIFDGGWANADPGDEVIFNIRFYAANAQQPEWDNPVKEYLNIPTVAINLETQWGNNFNVWQYTVDIPETYINNGWISIQSTDGDGWFLWHNATGGDAYAWQKNHIARGFEFAYIGADKNTRIGSLEYDLSMELYGTSGHPQPGTLTNIQVSQRTDGSGFVDIYFNLSGSAAAYNMSLEASFDAGSTYQPVPAAHLNGDVTSVSPGNNKHLVWDGFASFPNTYSTQSKLKIIASAATGGTFLSYCGIYGQWDDYNNYCIGEYGHDYRVTLDEASSSSFCDGYYKTYAYIKDDNIVALFISNGHCMADMQSFPNWPPQNLSEHCIIHGGTGNYKWRYHSAPQWQGNTVGVQCEVSITLTPD